MSLLFKYFLSPAKVDLLPTDGGRPIPHPGYGPALRHGEHWSVS